MPAPDPYSGTFAMFIDGVRAGTLASVDGCTPNYAVSRFVNGSGGSSTIVERQGFLACRISLGLDVPRFYDLLKDAFLGGFPGSHTISLAQYSTAGGTVLPKSAVVMEQAGITKFTIPPIESTSTTATFLVYAEIQSFNQTVHTHPSPAIGPNDLPAPRQAKASTLGVTIQNVTGTPAIATTEAYTWQMPVTRLRDGVAGWRLDRTGISETTNLAAAVQTSP